MNGVRKLLCGMAVVAVAAGVGAPAGATSLIRQSLDDLVAGNRTIVVGEVVDAHSYWNEEGTFILTDVRIAAHDVLKGEVGAEELTVTIMGGRVGDLTTLIIGGAELIPGRSYVLFLNEGDLPGASGVRTVQDHVQGVFDVVIAKDGLRAISQANRHPLVPDSHGSFDAPGGVEGFSYSSMVQSVREIAGRQRGGRPEVQ
jgi:hypothetical protein